MRYGGDFKWGGYTVDGMHDVLLHRVTFGHNCRFCARKGDLLIVGRLDRRYWYPPQQHHARGPISWLCPSAVCLVWVCMNVWLGVMFCLLCLSKHLNLMDVNMMLFNDRRCSYYLVDSRETSRIDNPLPEQHRQLFSHFSLLFLFLRK